MVRSSKSNGTPKNHEAHIEGFIETFIADEYRRRWVSLFALNPRAWSRVPVAGFPYQCKKECCYELVGIRESFYDDADLAVLGNGVQN